MGADDKRRRSMLQDGIKEMAMDEVGDAIARLAGK